MKKLSRKELLKKYDFVSSFLKGLAWVGKDGKQFHVHPDGTPAYKERYDSVGPFLGGIAWVKKDGEEFHIYPNGTIAD